jgi:hypothetical protein
MRNPISGAVRGVILPTLVCSLACGGAVAALAVTGVRELHTPATAVPAGPAGPAVNRIVVPPPPAVVVRTPPVPAISDAPTASVWVVSLPADHGPR